MSVVKRVAARLFGGGIRFAETSLTWEELVGSHGTYSNSYLLDRIEAHSRTAWNDLTIYERDGFFLRKQDFQWQALAAIFNVARKIEGKLCVVDFGGSFATLARQIEQIFGNRAGIDWLVVEQEAIAKRGRTLGLENVTFFSDLDEALNRHDPHVFLASSSLQYLRNPHAVIQMICESNIEHIILDRTAVDVNASEDVLTAQTVGKLESTTQKSGFSGKAAYPAWILSEGKLLLSLEEKFEVYFSFDSLDGSAVTSRGKVFSRKGYFGLRK